MRKLIPIFTLAAFAFSQSPSEELNTLLMHSTFNIWGPDAKAPGNVSFGTMFLMGMPIKDQADRASAILVTAGHVLDEIGGDSATIQLRRRNNNGGYSPFAHTIKIRANGSPLYLKHDAADVAAMYVDLPNEQLPITVLPPSFLADDSRVDQLQIHPGDEVFCLGFPLFASEPGGFPFLRRGTLASYPLTPMKVAQGWLFDAVVYPGNSGGPVYFHFDNRQYGGTTHIGFEQGIIGLIIQDVNSNIPEFKDKKLGYAVIVPSQFIRETIAKLPPESPYK